MCPREEAIFVPAQKCPYHVTFDLDLEHTLEIIVCKFGHNRAICVVAEAICAESLQTDRQMPHHCISSCNELTKTWVTPWSMLIVELVLVVTLLIVLYCAEMQEIWLWELLINITPSYSKQSDSSICSACILHWIGTGTWEFIWYKWIIENVVLLNFDDWCCVTHKICIRTFSQYSCLPGWPGELPEWLMKYQVVKPVNL